MRRTLLIAVGAIALVVGAVWTLQGAGVLAGSFMTGEPLWLVIGIVLLVVAGALFFLAFRRPARRP